MLDCDHIVKPDDFILMTRANSDYFYKLKKASLLVETIRP